MYYPIKCPYCLSELTNEEVKYVIGENAEELAAGAGNGAAAGAWNDAGDLNAIAGYGGAYKPDGVNAGFAEAGGEDFYIADDEVIELPGEVDSGFSGNGLGGASGAGSAGSAGSAADFESGAANTESLKSRLKYEPLTIRQIIDVWGKDNVRTDEVDVDVPPAFENARFKGKLINGVRIREDGRSPWRQTDARYCPYCRNVRLHDNSGKFPTFVVLLMGTRDAGKTVYLTSLYHTLSIGGGFRLPLKGSLSMSADMDNDLPIARYANDLFQSDDGRGWLPETTTALQAIPRPVAFSVSVSYGDSQNKSNLKSLLFLRDISGENLASDNPRLRSILAQFAKFDAFLLLLDPYTFPSARTLFPAWKRVDAQKGVDQLSGFQNIIETKVSRSFANGRISVPTTVLVTKGDIFFDKRSRAMLSEMGVKQSNPALANPVNYFDREYFSVVNRGTQHILEKLNSKVLNFLKDWFDDPYFAVVSALGQAVTVRFDEEKQLRYVDNPNLISPWKIAETLARLLMSLHALPPYDIAESRPNTEESKREREDRLRKNREIINKWGKSYCSGWNQIN